MNKRLILLVCLVGSLALGGTAFAAIGTIDNVPAATLLLPRFEVDLSNASGVDTLFSVNNASAAPALAHVTVWSEWSVPIIDFDIYLTGYDVQTISLRDVIVNGNLPQTGVAISNEGDLSLPNVNFPGCNAGTTPPGPPIYDPISASFQLLIQESLSGQVRTFDGQCASSPDGDTNIARGYITVDSVNSCDQVFPSGPGYFVNGGGPTAIANNNNVLWGDYFILDAGNAFAQGFNLVHIEAGAVGGVGAAVPGVAPLTFYARYSLGEDNREALGSKYATRFIAPNAFFTGGTDILSYRDPSPSVTWTGAPASCAAGPNPMSQADITVFDEEENPIIPTTGGPSGEPAPAAQRPFPWESNRTSIASDLDVGGFGFGWLYLNLNGADTGLDTQKTQAYVAAVMSADGLFSVGFDAVQLNNLTVTDAAPASP